MIIDVDNKQQSKQIKCQYCDKLFEKPCGLGGHMSRVHDEEKKRRALDQIDKKIKKENQKMSQSS